jgi:hypothetical protein
MKPRWLPSTSVYDWARNEKNTQPASTKPSASARVRRYWFAWVNAIGADAAISGAPSRVEVIRHAAVR